MKRLNFTCAFFATLSMCVLMPQVPCWAENDSNKSVMPLAFFSVSQEELDRIQNAELEDLRSLWSAVCEKSPDIQFATEKLKEKSLNQPPFGENFLSRALDSAMGRPSFLFTGRCGPSVRIPGSITQTEAIMLYDLVRRNADKVVELYR